MKVITKFQFFSYNAYIKYKNIIEEADTDLETDRLLGQQRTDDQGFFDDKVKSYYSFNNSFVLENS